MSTRKEVARNPAPRQEKSNDGARSVVLLGTSLILIAFNLRCAVTSVGPVLPDVIRDLGLSATATSILTTLPSLCFGLFGPAAPALGQRVGTERALMAGLALMVLGSALRGVAGPIGLFCGQVLACAGIAGANVLLPGLVKRHFPNHTAMITGLYVTSLSLGASAAAGGTVPLQGQLGGSWAAALAFWAAPAAVAAAVWGPQVSAQSGTAGPQDGRSLPLRSLWGNALAWQVTLFMGLQSALAYIAFGWFAPILQAHGLDPVGAGLVVSVLILAQAAGSLFAPALAARGRDQRLATTVATLLCIISFVGCVLAWPPSIWFWSIILGLSGGAVFAIALMLIVWRAPNHEVAGQLSSMAQSAGYLMASLGPFLAGVLHAWSGTWDSLAWFTGVIGVGMLASGIGASRARQVGGAGQSPAS